MVVSDKLFVLSTMCGINVRPTNYAADVVLESGCEFISDQQSSKSLTVKL
jgi:hypothetical protein